MNDQQVLDQKVIDLAPCEALALIQMGIKGLTALTDPGCCEICISNQAHIDQIGDAWMAIGVSHNEKCDCPDQNDMEKRIVVHVVDSLADQGSQPEAFDPRVNNHNHCRICGLCTKGDLCDGCEEMESL